MPVGVSETMAVGLWVMVTFPLAAWITTGKDGLVAAAGAAVGTRRTSEGQDYGYDDGGSQQRVAWCACS